MRHFLLDASVLVDLLDRSATPKAVKVRAVVAKLFALKAARRAHLYIGTAGARSAASMPS